MNFYDWHSIRNGKSTALRRRVSNSSIEPRPRRQPTNNRRTPDRNFGVAQTGLSLGSGVGELAKPSGRRLDLGHGGGKNFASIT